MSRPLPDRQGDQACAIDLVAPLASPATETHAKDDAGDLTRRARSCAVTRPSTRLGDVDSAIHRSTPTTAATPGCRTSTTATRTTTTRTTTTGLVRSANQSGDHAEFSFADLVEAYFDCREHKRNTRSALHFEEDLERNLIALYRELVDGSYRIGPSTCFVITRPKPREVWAANFRDRIVHHLLYNRVSARFYAAFIADSCASIPGRGTLYAAKRLESKVRSITENWSRPAFYLKCDIANFFVSIEKPRLAELLDARIVETWWRALAHQVLFHDPRVDVFVQGDPARLALIPPHKSLFNQDRDHGLPIGNLSSQFFANIYMDVLDQHVKHAIGARHYVRYVDDFVLLHESPQWLNAARREIEQVLADRLDLRLNQKKTVLQPIARGIDFAGQVIRPWHRTIRRRVVNDALARAAAAPDLHTTSNSYFGLFRQASHSRGDRRQLARVALRRGHVVDLSLMRTFRIKGYAP
jgi:RNA-directed DNA polymerase